MLRPNKIVILGGGSAGWMTATTLIRTFPGKDIILVESKDVPIVGVGESTIGGIREWAKYIGLDEKTFFPVTDASYKMSIKFTDFKKKGAGSFQYPFGFPQSEPGRNPFFDWSLKKYFYPDTPVTDLVDCLFPVSALMNQNKFSLNRLKEFDSYNPDMDLAYHFDATKFGIWLRDYYCIPRGVEHIQATVVDVKTNEKGVESLVLEDGTEITGDLFVDCTGWKSMLLAGALNEPFKSYENILPNNSAVATHLPYKDKEKELEPYTTCTAIDNGWVWNIPLWSRIGTGYVYSDKYINYDEAVEQLKQHMMSDNMTVPRTREEVDALEFRPIKMRIGIHERTFVKNVVAIGLSAGFIEPLESNGLYTVHEFLLKLIDILKYPQVNQTYIDMYNVACNNLFDTFAKFVSQHYALSQRDDTKYWDDISSKSFRGHSNDPYNAYITRNDTYASMINVYMDEWGYPLSRAGLPYIATGLGMNTLSEYRVGSLNARTGIDYESVAAQMVVHWEALKTRWKKAANRAPSLAKYLEDNFHGKDNSAD